MKRLWYHIIMVVAGMAMLFVSANAGTKQVSSSNIQVSSRALFGLAQSVITDGGYAYVAADNSVVTISLSNLSSPTFSGYSYPMEYIQDLCTNTDYIYATIGDYGIEVIPKATSKDPATIKTFDFGTFMGEVTIDKSKGILYVATADSGVLVLQIVGDSLAKIGAISGGFGIPSDVEYSNDTLIIGGSGGIFIYDVSTPSSPLPIDSILTKYGVYRVGFKNGNVIYAMNWVDNWEPYYSVSLFDGNLGIVIREGEGRVADICVRDTNLFILKGSGEIYYYVLSGGVPTIIDSLVLSSLAHDLDADTTFIYLVEDDGFHIIQYSNGYLESVSTVYSALVSHELATYGNYLFSAAGQQGIMVIDMNDTLNPQFAGRIPCNKYSMALSVKDTLLLCASLLQNFSVFNISNPLSPVFLGDIYVPANPMDVAWKDSIAYVATNTEGVALINIAKPDNLSRYGMLNTGSRTQSVKVYKNYLVVSDLENGSYIFDVTNPVSPTVLSTLGASRSAALNDTILVLATADSRLLVYNISNPANPNFMYSVELPQNATSIRLLGNMLYASCGDSGIRVYNLGSTSATLSGYFESGNRTNDVYPLTESLFYVSEEAGGIYLLSGNFARILDVTEDNPSPSPLVTFNRGNVFNGRISFNINSDEPVSYRIIDATGRIIRKGYTHGRERVQIDDLQSGVYFLNVHSACCTLTRPLVVK